MREGRPYAANEDDDGADVPFKRRPAEAPRHIGELMDRIIRPSHQTEAASGYGHESGSLLEEDEDDLTEKKSKRKKRARKIAGFLPTIIEDKGNSKDSVPSSAGVSDSEVSNHVMGTLGMPTIDRSHNFSLYSETGDTPITETPSFDTDISKQAARLPWERNPLDEADSANVENSQDDHQDIAEPVNPTELEVPANEGHSEDQTRTHTETGVDDSIEKDQGGKGAGEKNDPGDNQPPEPPSPPSPPGYGDDPGFGRVPKFDGGSSSSWQNSGYTMPSTSPNTASPRSIEQSGKRDNLGLAALVTAVFVHFRAKAREAEIVRKQKKKNQELEHMIRKKANKVPFGAQDPEASRPNKLVPTETPKASMKPITERIMEKNPIDLAKTTRLRETLVVTQKQREEKITKRSVPENSSAKSNAESVKTHQEIVQPPVIAQSESHARQPQELKSYKGTEDHSSPSVERIDNELEKNNKDIEQQIDSNYGERSYERLKTSSDLLDTDFVSNKENGGSAPAHIGSILQDRQFQPSYNPLPGAERSPRVSNELNKEYAKVGFVAAVVIVLGIGLVVLLR